MNHVRLGRLARRQCRNFPANACDDPFEIKLAAAAERNDSLRDPFGDGARNGRWLDLRDDSFIRRAEELDLLGTECALR
jgi:hypothetical protein